MFPGRSCCANRYPRPPADSIAHVRRSPANSLAQPLNSSTCPARAYTSRSATTTSCSSTATAVWVRLCGSIPIITTWRSSSSDNGKGPRWALLIRVVDCADLFRATPRQDPASRATRIESQPDTQAAGSSRATTTGPHRRYEQPSNATPDSIRQLWRGQPEIAASAASWSS